MNEDCDPYPSIKQDLNNIFLILQKTFEIPTFKRDMIKCLSQFQKFCTGMD